MSVLISVPIGMAISQYSNLNHACEEIPNLEGWATSYKYSTIQVYRLSRFSGQRNNSPHNVNTIYPLQI